MRTVGTKTLEAIANQVFERSLRVSIWDDDGVEIPIPFDLVADWPPVDGDLDTMVLRMTLRVVITSETAGKLLRGRKIQAWESFAAGEELELFTGFIADAREAIDYSSGRKRDAVDLTCVGELSRKLEAHLTRFEWRPAPMNPDAVSPYSPAGERIRLTGIIKTIRGTAVRPTPWLGVPIGLPIASPFFATNDLDQWVRVFNAAGTQMAYAGDYDIQRNSTTGWVEIVFSTDPGATFTIDLMAVDRWVILNRRTYHNGAVLIGVVPYYHILHGVAGQADTERLNDISATFIRADKPFAVGDFYVDRPEGYYASGHFFPFGGSMPAHTSADCWISVYSGSSEYRGKVATVNKTKGHAEYGRVTIDSFYPLRRVSDGGTPALVGNEAVQNTSTAHYELLDPGVKQLYKAENATSTDFPRFKSAPVGGWYIPYAKPRVVETFIPDYQTSTASGAPLYPAVADFGRVRFSATSEAIVIEAADLRPANDVAEWVKQLLFSVGVAASDIAAGATASGYALAPFTVTQKKAGDLVQEALKAAVPPTFRVRELEDGTITYGHIAQKSTADLKLRGLRNLQPRELPQQITRCVVFGRQNEVSRAMELLVAIEGFKPSAYPRLFDGVKQKAEEGAVCTTTTPKLTFRIPACEPGRFPNVGKVLGAFRGTLEMRVAGSHLQDGGYRYMPTHVIPNDAVAEVYNREFSDFGPIAVPVDGEAGQWYLQTQFYGRFPNPAGTWPATPEELATTNYGYGYDTVDDVQVHLLEGAYAEAFFSDQDGASLSSALDFAGAVQVALPAAAYFTGGDFTIECWAYARSWAGAIVSFWDSAASSGVLVSLTSFYGQVSVLVANPGQWKVVTTDPLWLNTPVHLAIVLSGTTLTIYRNGRFWTSGTIGTTPPAIVLNDSKIGRHLTFSSFDGSIDDVRLWSVARTQDQIRDKMFAELAGTEAGLVGYWKLNEGAGLTANDSTPNARHGTLTGGGGWTSFARRQFYASADQGAAAFGKTWTRPRSDLSLAVRYAPPEWLRRQMVDWNSGMHRTLVVEADGITQAQAYEVAQSYCDQAARKSEFWEAECSPDPRMQLGDTVEAELDDGSAANYLVWKYRKEKTRTKVTLANYAR